MNMNRSLIRGLIYALVFDIVTWVLFIALLSLPFSFDDSLIWGSFILWLMAIPFYFILKNDCGVGYLWAALGVHFVFTYAWTTIIFLIPDTMLPRMSGWEGLIYIFPIFGIPIAGALPIAIDILVYAGKALWQWLGNRSAL